MIDIYDNNGLLFGRAKSIRGACELSHENRRTISKKLNNPASDYIYNYYTRDARGHLIRLAYEAMVLSRQCAYPTESQIESCAKTVKELMK